jgi:glutamate-ammonia-ligase adenylyltransferase
MSLPKLCRCYDRPADAIEDFLGFAQHARGKVKARPDWKEWLLSAEGSSQDIYRGSGKWRQDWAELAGGCPALDRLDTALPGLRRLRQREYLRLGLLDYSGHVGLEEVMRQLSDLADFCLEAVLKLALAETAKRFGNPGTGFCVFGMGKLGAQELNYSSDIDVCFVYGEDGEMKGHATRHEFFTRVAQRIIKAFDEQSPDGNLFRIDLRLRPEGDSGPLVQSIESSENYYAAYGETWERMALLKTRLAAGDASLEYDFERIRLAFCFPRSLSPEVLHEIADIKGRIERDIVGAGNLEHHIKLGTGGIREIEFIVQSFQILQGARLPYLQQRDTLRALEAIRTVELLPRDKVECLADAYRFWRMVEHRLQMRADLQTHSLPRGQQERARIAESLGLEPSYFEAMVATHRRAVRSVFEEIFSQQQVPTPPKVDFQFFADPEAARRNLDALRPGRGSEHVAARTRHSWVRLLPELDRVLRGAVEPDVALARFVRFVDAYGARSLLFETLAVNPKALELMVKIFDRSEFYTHLMIARPELFEEAARAGTLDTCKNVDHFLVELRDISGDRRLESRLYRREELMRLFIRDILGLGTLDELQAEYSALAEACLRFAIEEAAPGSGIFVLAMGKFGGREIGYGADLDCLMVGEDAAAGREINRYMAEILPTGILFPMDFRLRPNGEGPICVTADAYRDYYAKHAQAWEIQALTRVRFAGGNEAEGVAFVGELDAIWHNRIRETSIGSEIAHMRQRIEKERASATFPRGEFKTGAGGLIDVEFGVQKILMEQGHREPSTCLGLEFVARRHPEVAASWRRDYAYLRRVEAVLRSDANRSVSSIPPDPRRQRWLALHLGYPSPEAFWTEYDETRARIRGGYEQLMNSDAQPDSASPKSDDR